MVIKEFHTLFILTDGNIFPYHFVVELSFCYLLLKILLFQEGGPLPGPETGLLSNTQK